MNSSSKHMLDNWENKGKVFNNLSQSLSDAETFRIVSAYFSIYGFDLLKDNLHQLKDVRFLYGDPSSVGELDPGDKEAKSFNLTEDGITPKHSLHQKALARQCEKWVDTDAVRIRSIAKSNFLHGKMYLTDSQEDGAAIVGSSNFTRRGLGGGTSPNLEINLQIHDPDIRAELRDWFDNIWSDKNLTEDVKQQVIDSLKRIGRDHAPELIYFKTLYELFKEDIEARQTGDQQLQDIHLYDTEIWNKLYEFQKDGVKSIIARLNRYNGCILADSVGLGKTYTALAVIKYFELRNQRALVLCPKKLHENWSLYPIYNSNRHNPFENDRFDYSLLSHTDLSRDKGNAGGINLANFNWKSFDLLVIDESHNFRNHEGKRYERLLNEVIKQGGKTKVLMLSATPVNTSLVDLRNQIHLMTENQDNIFNDDLGINSINNLINSTQRQFKQWEKSELPANHRRSKTELLENLGIDFFRLLGAVSISRSRRQVEAFYSQEMRKIGKFPKRENPENSYPNTDLKGELSYKDLSDEIEKFELSIYRPSEYAVSERAKKWLETEKAKFRFNQKNREYYLMYMMRVNFLKRLESSPHSLTLTLKRTIEKINTMLGRIEEYQRYRQTKLSTDELTTQNTTPDEDEDDEDFLINRRAQHPYSLHDLDTVQWAKDLYKDREVLDKAYKSVKQITPRRDGKLLQIKQHIRDKALNPTTDRKGRVNRKLLIFTTFKDTAQYLYDNLYALAHDLNLSIAMVSGDTTRTTAGGNNFNDILTNFAPAARNRNSNGNDREIDILIATDCISEGQNLQDCDTVINYDIHWNPVRIIQRFGRIDRIGSQNDSIRMVNYWPTAKMEHYLHLQTRVQARMALADATASGDENLLDSEADFQTEISFRDQQLMQLRDEILDLDDQDDGLVMSDFTLDYFFSQLLQYLEKNKDELDQTPYGAYAITSTNLRETHPGIIWVLKQRNTNQNQRLKVTSPVHPFYLVHIRENGDIRYTAANARQTLDLFEALAAGQTEPINQLCAKFDRETNNGTNMYMYSEFLNKAIDHISQAHNATQTRHLGMIGNRDFKLTPSSQAPRNENDFELVTWLIIRPDLYH